MIKYTGRTISFLTVLFLGFGASIGAADDQSIMQTDLPGWFRPSIHLDLSADSGQRSIAASSGTGLEYLLLDRQMDVASAATTSHVAFRITSEAGLSDGAQISQTFDPAYEACEYHFIRVWRQGEVQDRLNLAEFKVLQQERDLDRQLYNGKLSAVLLLRDVRVGDIVEYACTRRGANPVFGRKFVNSEETGWASPVRDQFLRVLVPPGRTVYHLEQGKSVMKLTSNQSSNGMTELIWTGHELPAVSYEGDAPSWLIQYPYIELSEFTDWKEVVDWARSLYDQKEPLPNELREKTRQLILHAKTAAEKTVALLDFVQREIRYLGFELGPNSHQPHRPGEVFAHRYGDCKDKVTLLCALLGEAGITARPALVNTYQKHTVADRLPGPFVFNHVVAVVTINGKEHWVDPTQTYQRGNLAARGFSEESRALVVATAKAGQGLTKVPISPSANPTVEVYENFQITDYTSPVKLKVSYVYSGEVANNIRYYLANTLPEEVNRSYLDYQKRSYPQLSLSKPLQWTDQEAQNTIHLQFECSVPNFWKPDSSRTTATAEFYPWPLHSHISQPEQLTRETPMDLSFPSNVDVTIDVALPDEWQLKNESDTVNSPQFKFASQITSQARQLKLRYTWVALKDHVRPDELSAFVEKLAEARRHAGYSLTRNLKLATAMARAETNWISITLTVGVLFGWAWFGWWINRRPTIEAPPLVTDKHLQGLSGWLILPAFGLVVRPFILGAAIYGGHESYYTQRVWLAVMSADSSAYQPGLGFLILFELAGNLSMLALSVIACALFFRSKRQLPKVMVALLCGTAVFMLIDYAWGNSLTLADRSGLDQSLKTAGQSIFAAVIWVPYFLKSRRVIATFVR